MNSKCPHFFSKNSVNLDNLDPSSSPKPRLIVRNGSYFRKSDSKHIAKFYCKSCEIYFSRATGKVTFGQKKRRVNIALSKLLLSGVSQRRAAYILKINRKTVSRKFKFLGANAVLKQEQFLKKYEPAPLKYIQWDDMETSEHSKCKPLSIALAVEPKTRKILNFQVSQMPAKGHLAKIAFSKYGDRKDERIKGWNQLFESLKPITIKNATFLSDENPHYAKVLKRHFPPASKGKDIR